MSQPAAFYVYWFNDCNCQIACEPANTIEEARNIISNWVQDLESGDLVKIKESGI